jgi:beta-glucosidase
LAGQGDPLYDLKFFSRDPIKAGETKTISFRLNKESFHQINEEGEEVLRSGDYKVYVSGALPSKRSLDLGGPRHVETSISF